MSEFEKQVRHALIEREMSMTSLAEALGISVSYLYELLKGTRKSEDQKQKIRQLLGIPDIDCDGSEQNVCNENSATDAGV